jgi:hypothetical protein
MAGHHPLTGKLVYSDDIDARPSVVHDSDRTVIVGTLIAHAPKDIAKVPMVWLMERDTRRIVLRTAKGITAVRREGDQ